MALKVLGVSGSMRAASHSARVLGIVLQAARERGAETRLLDLREADLPVYRPDATEEVAGEVYANDAVG